MTSGRKFILRRELMTRRGCKEGLASSSVMRRVSNGGAGGGPRGVIILAQSRRTGLRGKLGGVRRARRCGYLAESFCGRSWRVV